MLASRVLMLGLDGFELSVADSLIAAGRLPALARLRAQGAFVRLDHGEAKRTGLAWEHVSSGLAPDAARRWAAVDFDPATYRVRQQPTSQRPFAAQLNARTVVFDPPYFDLSAADAVHGLVAWGAHDPGVAALSRPGTLSAEIRERFGKYPAAPWIYGFVWPSPARAREMAQALRQATRLRGEIAQWLLCERLPDWDLGIVVVSEFHSALEALWHGIDPAHPLHHLPSAAPARQGIEWVYEEADRMIARLHAALPDVHLLAFSLHGMGANDSDVASMALLPELMYRHAFGWPRLREPDWPTDAAGIPMLDESEGWSTALARAFGDPPASRSPLPGRVGRWLDRHRSAGAASDPAALGWMPGMRYRDAWPTMPAFALPSFYDGRIRVNLAGREAQGLVGRTAYAQTLDGIEAMLGECRDVITGRPMVARFERCARGDPLELSPSEADMVVLWNGAALGLEHPRLGRIGPLPYRRTGGHTGRCGAAWISGPGIPPLDLGMASAFDIVPTVIDLLGEAVPPGLSGRSLLKCEVARAA